MMTTEGWTQIMAKGVDARGIEKEPKYKHNEYQAIFFVIFMIIGCFLLINLFTAVITDHINKVKESKNVGSNIMINEYQKQYVDIQNLCLKTDLVKKTTPPRNRYRLKFYKIVNETWFDLLIIAIIMLNT